MPAPTQSYEVLLDFTNDTHDCATIQLLRDYGRNTSTAVLLHPGESVALVLDAGFVYKYALKSRSKVANVRCVNTWIPPPACCMCVSALDAGEIYDAICRSYSVGGPLLAHHRRVHRQFLLPTVSPSTEYGGIIASTCGTIRQVI